MLSCVPLLANPRTAARLASSSVGFPRPEYWSGLPFPPSRIFPAQGLNQCLLRCRWILYHLRHQINPTLEKRVGFHRMESLDDQDTGSSQHGRQDRDSWTREHWGGEFVLENEIRSLEGTWAVPTVYLSWVSTHVESVFCLCCESRVFSVFLPW